MEPVLPAQMTKTTTESIGYLMAIECLLVPKEPRTISRISGIAYWLRRGQNRGLILLLVGGGALALGAWKIGFAHLRGVVFDLLPAVFVVFTFASAVVLVLFSSTLLRLNEVSFEQARRVKTAAARAHAALIAMGTDEAKRAAQIYPDHVMEHSLHQIRNSAFGWDDGTEAEAFELLESELGAALEYLVPLRDELQELKIILIRRVASEIHRQLLWSTFGIVALAMALLVSEALLRSVAPTDVVFALAGTLVLGYAPIHLLVSVSWVDQEAAEHVYPEPA